MIRFALTFWLVVAVSLVTASHAQVRPIRGFPDDAVAAERQREEQFRKVPDSARLKEYMEAMAGDPHVAGQPSSKRVADYALAKFKAFGLDAKLEEFEAMMPWPLETTVDLVAPEKYALRIKEPVLPEDPDSGDQTPLYNAYSGDGDVTGEVVYVNYGMPADFARLKELGISVKGKIVLARYGAGWRGIKPKVAAENGAIGCLIFSDPRDDGFFQGDVYPIGPYRPEFGAQRGSVMDMPIHPGDPLTPGWGSEAGGRKNSREDAATILKIPVLPIGYGDALPILRQLKGPVAPQEWRGALPVTYHLGPGPAELRMKLSFEWKNRPLYNVVARIPGATRPDEWIIYGNHHDAWVSGADDPISGASSLMETARGLGELLKTGWRPSRTIILALWDGEEWGLLGSTEWAEKHGNELKQKAVAYINTDGTGKGWLGAGGSHGLQQMLGEVAKDVMDPRTAKPVFDEARRRSILGLPEAERAEAEKDPSFRIAPLGSGSDYTPFLQHLTLSALNVGFGGESPGGVYHSAYDTVKWYQTHSDGDYTYGRTLSQITGTLILRLSEAPVLPFQFVDTADTLLRYVVELEKLAETKKDSRVDMRPVRNAVEALKKAGEAYEKAYAGVTRANAAQLVSRKEIVELNRLLLTSEQKLGNTEGLPRREWFKHQMYAPGFYTGYGVKTMPQIREGLEENRFTEAQGGVRTVSAAVNALAAQVNEAVRALQQATR
ncbi:MAG TPA: M28 family peptidase [Vicinamibacterales bacterium]|nr:M28 family peptidase [Vicinamibacterales bacterium]